LPWIIEFDEGVEKTLKKLGPQASRLILDYLRDRIAPAKDPRSSGKPLQGPLKGLWRYRVGDYRIISRIEDDKFVVLVVAVGHRKNVYE
jgi:mRNA interferase RelE/StbE